MGGVFSSSCRPDCTGLFVWLRPVPDISQAYESWSFEQDLRDGRRPFGAFCGMNGICLLSEGWQRGEIGPPDEAWLFNNGQKPAAPKPQSMIGRVEIPRLKLNVMIREGVDSEYIAAAVGHIPSTSLPGDPATSLWQHTVTPIFCLWSISETGDLIEVETHEGSYKYVVESTQVVKPKEVWVLNARDHPTLTLITCFPFRYIGAAPQRFIVRAAQVGTGTKSLTPSGS